MRIPGRHLETFVREVVDACLTSQHDRIQRGLYYRNYYLSGSERPDAPAAFNKTFAHVDDLASTLYSPISLRLKITDPDLPNILTEAKGRAAASRLRILARQSNVDSMTGSAVVWSLVKGKTFIKQMWKRGRFDPEMIMPEAMGVLKENHDKLDEGMEAFCHSMLLSPHELRRIIWDRPDRDRLLAKLRGQSLGQLYPLGMGSAGAEKQVIVGGLYPFQPSGSPYPNQTRGVVDWMGGPQATLSPALVDSLVRMDEAWIWDDERADWTTFQIIGDELVWPIHQKVNLLAYNPLSQQEIPDLKGHHPFCEFCSDPLEGYFWGRSEVINVWLLQEFINKRISGINRMLRKEEEPSTRFTGVAGVNQNALNRYRAPGGYFSDQNPGAKIEETAMKVPQDVWAALHEYERMFDVMAGKPPVTQGRGEPGVRAQGHAQTLIAMASPRFKDRALLIERDCEGLYSLGLDIMRVHDDKKLTAWVPEQAAGAEAMKPDPLLLPPVPGFVAVSFAAADLPEDVVVSIDSHSASPIFALEEKQTVFDAFKVGAMGLPELIERLDLSGQDELIAGVERREAAKAAQIQVLEQKGDEKAALKLVTKGR